MFKLSASDSTEQGRDVRSSAPAVDGPNDREKADSGNSAKDAADYSCACATKEAEQTKR